MDYQIISGDGHVDLSWLPHNLFVDGAPEQWRSWMPRVEDGPKGPSWRVNGRFMAPVGVFRWDQWTNPAGFHREKRLEEVGFAEDSRRGVYHPSDPELRVKDQDLDGIDAEVIYGLAFGPDQIRNMEARALVYRIYNDWAAEFAGSNPERLACLACLPHDTPQSAADELRRAAGLGLKGAEFRVALAPTAVFNDEWDVLWQTAVECDMPISFHLLENLPKVKEPREEKYFDVYWTVALTMAQLDGVEHLSCIVLSGACERFPDFKFVLGEAGVGWIPYVIDRMDHEGEGIPGLSMKPSEYWYRQGHSTFQKEGIAGDLISLIGEDNVMWGNDYPHNDCVWPDSRETIEYNLKGLADPAVRRKVVCENAGRLYGFIG